ncbi:MAG: aldo/keto reductase [Planctomycetota bacterium]
MAATDRLPTRPFGDRGVDVSIMGLGCGGPSRLGTRGTVNSETTAAAVAVLEIALASGVTLLDTAESYGTQPAIAEVIRACRDDVVLCTKKAAIEHDASGGTRFVTAAEYAAGIDGCLRELGVEAVDVFFLHGITPEEYGYASTELLPVLERAQRDGKCRWIGVTEMFQTDTTHAMLTRALDDGWPEVVMVGFNPLNQSARETILPRTTSMGVATLGMFAVRRALSNPARLRELLDDLRLRGLWDAEPEQREEPLGFLGAWPDVIDAAYRYSLHEPGLDCTLMGTGDLGHLQTNLDTARRGPLASDVHRRLSDLFRGLDSVTGH